MRNSTEPTVFSFKPENRGISVELKVIVSKVQVFGIHGCLGS